MRPPKVCANTSARWSTGCAAGCSSERGRQLRAFAHGALGVEFARLARAADVVDTRNWGLTPFSGLLASADDDCVRLYEHWFLVNDDMNPSLVDSAVFHPLDHAHAIARELGAVHPAGRAA